MLTLDKLSEMNEWWRAGSIRKELAPDYKRKLFSDIQKYIKKRQIVAFIGLRRTGKSTLMYQLIRQLIHEGIGPKHILYFSFDEAVEELREVIGLYQENILRKELSAEKIYIFLDELQKLKDWQNKLKIYYDLYPNIKFFISGSATINRIVGSKESLAGRVFYFSLDALSFEEFLELRGKDVKSMKKDINLWKSAVKAEITDYLLKPFPEIAAFDDEMAKKYIKESIVEKAIFKDLSSMFEVKDIELIEKIVYIISSAPGMSVNLDDLSKDLGKSRQVISNYLYYLECSFMLKSLRNFKGSFRASSRKLKKYYPIHPCLSLALSQVEKGKAIESLVQFAGKFGYFWRERDKEVDFIAKENGRIIPIESKYVKKASSKDLKGMLKFMDEFKVKEGIVITDDYEKEEKAEWFGIKGNVKFIPLWKWLLN